MKASVALVGVFALFAAPAMASVVADRWIEADPSDELNVYEIYNQLYGSSYASTADLEAGVGQVLPGELFELVGASGSVTAEARYAAYTQEFGWYEDTGGGIVQHVLFNVTDTGMVDSSLYTASIAPAGQFGLFDTAGGTTWFSEAGLNDTFNPAGEDHVVVYNTPFANRYLLVWEDLPMAVSDLDFNDLVIELYLGTDPNIIPEPASMLLLGLGIAGMVVRKFVKA